MTDPSPLTMTRAEVARELQITERQVDKLWRKGELPQPVRIGSSIRFIRAQVLSRIGVKV